MGLTRFRGDFTPDDGGPTINGVKYEGGAAPDGELVPAVRLDDQAAKVYTADGASTMAVVGEAIDTLVRLPLVALAALFFWAGALLGRNALRGRPPKSVR